MKNFKEMLDKDLDTTFFNTAEFAEIKRIRYDGFTKSIPVIFDLEEEKNRKITANDNAEGIHKDYTVIRVKLCDMGKEPRHGARFWLEDELFLVTRVSNQYNELIIELERFDE